MIQVSNIIKNYKSKTVLNGVSFSASKGECIGIVGANGCGKSTLLAIMAGALKADSGTIHFNEKEAVNNPKIFSEYVAYVPQENPILEELTVQDNLKLWYTYSGKNLKEDLTDGLPALMELEPVLKVTAGKLSGGMKKRLSIACALCNKQPVLIMDEPSAALDLVCKADIYKYMNYYMKEGGTILITTHDETELAMCSRLLVIKGGGLKEVSSGLSVAELVKEFTDS